MTELQESAAALMTQVDQARHRLAEAAAAADLAGIAEALDQLERVHAQARDSGIPIPHRTPAAATPANETPS